MTKICKLCKIEKDVNEFSTSKLNDDGLKYICKSCEEKSYVSNSKNPILNALTALPKTWICTQCKIEKPIEQFYKRKITKKCSKGFRSDCIECSLKACKKWRSENKEHISEYHYANKERRNMYSLKGYYKNQFKNIERNRQYRKDNKDDPNFKQKERNRKSLRFMKRYNEDICFRIMKTVSRAINHMLKSQGGSKCGHSISEYLQYTPQQLVSHLESQFNEYMSWDNYGKYWHLDHIIPQSYFPYDNMEHPNFLKCCDLMNLRPLEKMANMRKGDKILEENLHILEQLNAKYGN